MKNLIGKDDFRFLETLTQLTVDACRVTSGVEIDIDKVGRRNILPFDVIRPGGRDCYPAIWVQDFTMIFASKFVSHQNGLDHLKLILRCQNGPEPRPIKNQAIIPPFAIPDHINFDGMPVFFPGTYSSSDDQGGEPYGLTPPFNNHYDVIWLTEMLVRYGDSSDLLSIDVKGMSVYDRLKQAFDVPTAEPDTGIVYTTPERRAVGFIFCDSIYMTGHLLMASLLRRRAAMHLAFLANQMGKDQDIQYYRRLADLIAANIVPTFSDVPQYGRWLKASTGISCQPGVWGTVYGLYTGVIKGEMKNRSLQTIVEAIADGQIESEGAFRHVPVMYDFSEDSSWEKTPSAKNRYQNGAYWHMPAGWMVSVLENEYPEIARGIIDRYIRHMRENSFTKGVAFCAPWECLGRQGQVSELPS